MKNFRMILFLSEAERLLRERLNTLGTHSLGLLARDARLICRHAGVVARHHAGR